MAQRLLTTKLYLPPARTSRVVRPRLLAQLDLGLHKSLTLISAPAGYGKTTLLSDWYAQTGCTYPLAWLSLDQNDNHLARFLTYLAAALETLDPTLTQDFSRLLLMPQLPSIEELVTELINGISAYPQDFALVLDDYHMITQPAIQAAVAYLLDHIPPRMHLVLLTRSDPPIQLARLRARNQMVELRAADLRFLPEETGQFLNTVMDLRLSGENISALEQRTEGWIAGIQLAALSMQRHADAGPFIQAFTGSNRYILDFLSEEVLQQQPEPVQTFLLKTAVLDRLTASLCDAVLGGTSNSAQMLVDLERQNMFLVPLDDERKWYRYHHLFSDLLFQCLQRMHPEWVQPLYARAATWCEQNGSLESAIGYALKAQQFDQAARLMDQIKTHLWDQGEIHLLILWLNTLPEDLVQKQPELSLDYAACLTMAGYFDAAENWLQLAESGYRALAAHDPPAARRAAVIPVYRSVCARFHGDFARAVALCQLGLSAAPDGEDRLKGVILLFLGQAHYYSGDIQNADRVLGDAVRYTLTSGHTEAYLNTCHHLAQIRVLQGRLHEAGKIAEQAVLTVEARGTPVYGGTEHADLADLHREWNHLDLALAEIRRGLELAEAGDHIFFLLDVYLVRVRLARAQNDWETAWTFLHKAERVARRCPSATTLEHLRAWEAWLHLAQGNLAEAGRWAANVEMAENGEMIPPQREFDLFTLARVWLAQGKSAQATALLETIRVAAQNAGRYGSALEARILQARCDQQEGKANRAVEKLVTALENAEPEGYVRLFLDEGPLMAQILYAVTTQTTGIASNYARKLLTEFSQEPSEWTTLPTALSKRNPGIEPLSDREVEVLRLIAKGCANKEIAAQLVISVGTVKRHVIHILQKLSADNRTEAVAIAREWKII